MLQTYGNKVGFDQFIEKTQAYVESSLHVPISLHASSPPAELPAFFSGTYWFVKGEIANKPCVLMVLKREDIKTTDLRKHINQAQAAVDAPLIMGFLTITPRRRDWLIEHHFPFIVPDQQLYLPHLGAVLNEAYATKIKRPVEALSPVSQAVLFYLLLRPDQDPVIPSMIATTLWYSPMSISRAVDELETIELVNSEKVGRKRYVDLLLENRRATFDRARPYIRTPALGNGHPWPIDVPLPHDALLSGESALSELTILNETGPKTYAIHASDWAAASRELVRERYPIDHHEAEIMIETWQYNPAPLAEMTHPNFRTVDPLSLHALLHDHEDERVRMAAYELIEELPW